MTNFFFVIIGLLPPLMCGPLPVILWFKMGASQRWQWQLPLAALLAIILNLLASVVILTYLNRSLTAGFIAFELTPMTVPATLILALVLAKRSDKVLLESAPQ